MVEPEESGVTEGGKNTVSFLFHELTQQSTNTKPQAIKKATILTKGTAPSGGKRCREYKESTL